LTELDTHFASAERLEDDEIYLQTIKILGLRKVLPVLNILPNMVVIINKQRQVVFANYSFTKMIGKKRFEDGLGERPGELISCVHAFDHISGCGTGEACRYCGAILTVLKAQETGKTQEGDAILIVKKKGEHIELNYHIIANPLPIEEQMFYLVVFTEKK
jgi:PAS domain-containing protein